MSYIGLLDCNNFFVSCERLFRPDLKGKPVVVLSGNDGCVVARSNEVKELGVPMGIPYFQVKQDLTAADCAVFSSNFPLYRDISRRVMATLKELSPQVEQYSVDEAFFRLDVRDPNSSCSRSELGLGLGPGVRDPNSGSGSGSGLGSDLDLDDEDVDRDTDRDTGEDVGGEAGREVVLAELRALKQVIEQKVGVPVSIGVAKTKTIAKYAAEKEKRGSGVCMLVGEAWRTQCATLPINTIWGIGAKTSQKMRSHNIVTVADFLACDPARIERLFGIDGLRKREELSERVAYGLGDARGPQKSIMSTRSFQSTTTDKAVVRDALAYHVAHAAEELRSLAQKARYVRILAQTSRHSDWMLQGGAAEQLLDQPTNDTRQLMLVASTLLDTIYKSGVPYKKAGVILGGFVDETVDQLNLFADPAVAAKDGTLMHVVDTLNQQFGQETVTIGRTGKGTEWRSSRKFVSPHYTTKWGEIPRVRT